ncbi:hypothetical protein GO730_14515 [Spirosoma sp. HMF3257]|uniref:hypothetical protein n=1 Tax=Spirosoma telluris TaxID=2183553 RepID=UPI000DAE54FB|nr:hypothetical protein [Spirosoma telluris]
MQAYRGYYDYRLYEPPHQAKLYVRFQTETPHLANRIENWSPPARFGLLGCELTISSSIITLFNPQSPGYKRPGGLHP